MVRILTYLVLIFLAGLGFAWLADRPGELVVTVGGYEVRATLMVAASALAVIAGSVLLVWWILAGLWNSPRTISRYFRARKRDRGYQALSTGLIAAGAGDGATARRMSRQVAGLLSADQEPLLHLLEAQALMLEGDLTAARAKFAAMAEDPETRLLGLRGLYLEAERSGDAEAARQIAERAGSLAPQAEWAAAPTLAARIARGDFAGALAFVDQQRNARQIDRPTADRHKAVILTAQAMALEDSDRAGASAAANEANRLAPDLVPAALIAARALFAANDLKRGSRLLEAAWSAVRHPDLAAAYVAARPGDSASDRLKRAEKLVRLTPEDAEAHLAVARAALTAGEFAAARLAAEKAIALSPREGACLLMADIVDKESRDEGRMRYWLGRAVRAPSDPAWVADGRVSERWAPFSPVTGRLDAFQWRPPVERLDAPVVEPEPALLAPPAEPPAAAEAPKEAAVETEPTPPRPDDPGTDQPGSEAPARRRFRLF